MTQRYLKRLFTSTRGLSLIEVVVSLLIISLSLIAITPLFRQGTRVETTYEAADTALSIAQKKMESLRSTDYTSLSSQPATADATFPSYTVEVTVTQPESLLKAITVTVRWTSKDGIAQNYQLATLRTDH